MPDSTFPIRPAANFSGTPPAGDRRTAFDTLERRIAELEAQSLIRRRRVGDTPCAPRVRVDGQALVAFASNDYLGLANHAALIDAIGEGARRYGAGSGGSHLLGGHSRAHAILEDALASYVGAFARDPRALSFSTGYMANMAILTALAGRGATVYSDALNHASLIDGARLSRADVRIYPHADAGALGAMLEADRRDGVKLIVTDAVFSMDGDVAPLRELAVLAERHQAWLVVDDAHGFGLQGMNGAGTVAALGLQTPLLVYMGTLGKAAGVAGAFVVAEATVIEWLIQRARTYIFTTAAAPALAHAATVSVALMRGPEGDARRARLRDHIEAMQGYIAQTMWGRPMWGRPPEASPRTPILPIVVGANEAAMALADCLLERGFWLPAVRPPTVPAGTARLRLSLSAAHDAGDIARLGAALVEASRRPPMHQA
ncbi:aminotransferase class I/II-fold pyridoxal phosphate-dependent enzyme [Bordetella genomosp. 9]|uniref:8-amino-7-oxononanoate synthase n=1 Tax=Bordetella genomosp. 9 TaxID=1416803 RepID=A0A1W6YYV8_9BORD|nr:8-amino-7-oxononanoate synthase [Bordetella genomosp. 9]ARP86134.1 8-amino-7-oxononanoate synthase [Bordetella genomosp. 9]